MNNSKSEFPRDGSVLVVVTARMRSARCPGKVLAELAGKPLIEHLLERMVWVAGREQVVLATSESPENKILVELAESLGVAGFIGDEEDVLGRHVEVARRYEAEHVVRVTGDNPLTDLGLVQSLTALQLAEGADYSYVPGDALFMGILPELISREALERSHRDGEERHRSEFVTLYIKEKPNKFQIRQMKIPETLYRPEFRLTVDEPPDLELMRTVFERLYRQGKIIQTQQAIELLDAEPALAAVNKHIVHRAANLRSVILDGSILD